MLNENVEDFLEHFGVKGMKWGVRNASGRTGKEQRAVNRARTQNIQAKRMPAKGSTTKKKSNKSLGNKTLKFIAQNPALVLAGGVFASGVIARAIIDKQDKNFAKNFSYFDKKKLARTRIEQPTIGNLADYINQYGYGPKR